MKNDVKERMLNWRDKAAYRHQKTSGRQRLAYAVDARGRACYGIQRYGLGYGLPGMPPDACYDVWVPRRKLGKKLRLAVRANTSRSVYLYFVLPVPEDAGRVLYIK